MRLKYQLFLTLLLVSTLLIALMAGIGRASFDRGFREYVNEVERERLAPLAEALAEGYAGYGDWAWVAVDDGETWAALIGEHVAARPGGRPPRGPDGPDGSGRSGGPEGPGERGDRGPPPGTDARLLLADADHRVLIDRARPGRAGQPVRWQPIELDGAAVGYLGHRRPEPPPGDIDEAFAAQQRHSFLYAAAAMGLLSAVLAIPLAARIVRPLLGVADAVTRIGRGEYAHRMPVDRRDEIGDLARDVNRLAATLETSLAARRRWLAEISHELRTPVAILRGELEAIQDGVQRLDAAAIDSLHAEALRLGRLVDDLHALTLSDAGALDYRFEDLDLREVLAGRLDAGRGGGAERSIALEWLPGERPVDVRGDRQRLEQLVDNLLRNSLRYTDEGGTVRVTLSRIAGDGVGGEARGVPGDGSRDGNGRAIIDWSDSAPGVGAEHLPRLFEPLYRVDASRHRDTGGAGLGLAIAARIVEAHGGTVSAHPSALGGLSVRIELPTTTGGTA